LELTNERLWNKLNEQIPSGPQALSLDVNFPKDSYLYGIPERINSFILKNTTSYHSEEEADPSNPKHEPYRLWNTDHFEDKFNFHTLYGSIPVLHSR
jgi:alpha 1,3-glucosidase